MRVDGRIVLLWALPMAAQADALEWLQRMGDATRNATYEGTAVYRNGDQLETLKLFHEFADGQERERVVALSGEKREVLRHADKVTCILSDQKTVLQDDLGLHGLLPKLPRAAFEQLSSHYDMIEVAGASRVAGRSCREIQIRARDIYRYNYQLCLDDESALPLDVRLISEAGELLEQVIFTDIQFPERIDPAKFQASVDASEFSQAPAEDVMASAVPELLWEMQDLPAGFRLSTREFGALPGFDEPVTQLMFSDGLASVSVFATPEQLPDEALQGLMRMGGVNAYGLMRGKYHITVIGEVPRATVRFFGDNLRQVSLADTQ